MGIKVDSLISPALLTEHWLRLNKKETIDKTLKAFSQEFPRLKNNTICQNVITAAFMNGELSRMNQNPQAIATPSLALEKWLIKWKEKHPTGEKSDVIKSLNKEFPLLAGNAFVLAFFDRYFQEIK